MLIWEDAACTVGVSVLLFCKTGLQVSPLLKRKLPIWSLLLRYHGCIAPNCCKLLSEYVGRFALVAIATDPCLLYARLTLLSVIGVCLFMLCVVNYVIQITCFFNGVFLVCVLP